MFILLFISALHLPVQYRKFTVSFFPPYAVPLSVVLAVPMYANAAGIVPVIEVFVAKGIPIGTALAFMMAVVGLSLPEATLLKKVMTWRLIGIFFGLITLFIIMLGYLYNIVL